jgi:hypothetical protein
LEESASEAPAEAKSRRPRALLWVVFVSLAAAYGLVAYERLAQPSPQFHFVDLAHSWMDGRLDTDAPRQRAGQVRDGDPAGYRDAIARTLDAGGWNDWASVRTLTLEDGTVVRGRYPWSGDLSARKHLFHTIDGEERKVVIHTDLARNCGSSGRQRCDETHHYVSFPPGPTLVYLPLALVFGYNVNDVWVTLLVAALNGVLLFLFLELLVARGHSSRSRDDNLWLTLLFSLGSVAFFSSVRGEVWFTALIFGVTCNLCFLLAALDVRRPLLAGVALAVGMATRTPIAFCFVFFGWQLFFGGGRLAERRIKEILVKGALFSLPILVIGGLLVASNVARFGEPTEFGHRLLAGGAGDRIRDHGLFNLWYLDKNVSAAFLNLPEWIGEAPYLRITKHGLSLLFTTPALLWLLRPASRLPLRCALWAAVVCAAVPGLLYQNTGWAQFGYRFALDYLPYLVALLAIGARPMGTGFKAVILWGVLVNLFGAITFGRFESLYH